MTRKKFLEEINFAYLAGVVDSDGYVAMLRPNAIRPRSPRLVVGLTDEPLIDWLLETFGGDKNFAKAKNSRSKDMYVWRLRGKYAVSIMKRICPYMRHNLKKQRSMLIAKNYVEIKGTLKQKEKARIKRLKLDEDVMGIQMRGSSV